MRTAPAIPVASTRSTVIVTIDGSLFRAPCHGRIRVKPVHARRPRAPGRPEVHRPVRGEASASFC